MVNTNCNSTIKKSSMLGSVEKPLDFLIRSRSECRTRSATYVRYGV